MLLAAVLITCSVLLAYYARQFPVGYYLLKSTSAELHTIWYWDILGRLMIFFLACGWIILMLNILPNKMNYVAYVGMNTMPVYILHLIVRYEVKKRSIFLGIFPHNPVLYYVLIFGLASLCVFVFSSKPVVKGYDFVVEGSYNLFMKILPWCKRFLMWMRKPVAGVANFTMNLISGDLWKKTKPEGEESQQDLPDKGRPRKRKKIIKKLSGPSEKDPDNKEKTE